MDADQEKQTETSRPGSTGPGERLQAERIKKGLSLEDVASRMHLSANILEAIENNNFEEITAPIFVKGYLRAYARIVSLDEDDMIQQYLDLYSEEDPPIHSTSNMAPELSSDDTRIKWTTYLVVLLLAVLLGAWWWNKQQNLEPPVSLDVQSPVLAEEDAAPEPPPAIDTEVETETVTAEVVVDEPADTASDEILVDSEVVASSETGDDTVSVETMQAETDITADTGSTNTPETMQAAAVEPDADVDPVEIAGVDEAPEPVASDIVAASAVEAESGTRERPGRSAPVGDDSLRIVVHADTWADVKDANNFQLEYNLLRAGSTADFTGKAPFSVFLGNGHGVEVLYNGEEIGFASRIRDDNTARLNVGG